MAHISLIVAMDDNQAIGANNQLLWRLPAELQYFKRITLGKSIVMGRKTHESIGKTLPGRRNIVISKNANFKPTPGCERASALDAAITLLKDETEIMVIGGGKIYEQALPLAEKLYITHVHHIFVGDIYFPKWNAAEWLEMSREKRFKDLENPYDMTFLVLARTQKV